MATVKRRDIDKSDGPIVVIKGVDIGIADGGFVVFVGTSGCGEATVLCMIAGLENITSGTLEIDGQRANDLEPSKGGSAMAFEGEVVFPHMTVRENVGFGLTIKKVSKADDAAAVALAARILQMQHLLDRHPSELSGGQCQCGAIGWVIVRDPKVILINATLSNLEAALRMDMQMEIGKPARGPCRIHD